MRKRITLEAARRRFAAKTFIMRAHQMGISASGRFSVFVMTNPDLPVWAYDRAWCMFMDAIARAWDLAED